jgi:RNA polymerase sigma-70 factor (ECF subfamily)
MVDRHDETTRFIELLTHHQNDIFAYVNTLLMGGSDVDDVVQETTLDLWARKDQFDQNRPFLPWAFGFAFQRVLAHRKAQQRSRIVFSDDYLASVSDAYVAAFGGTSTLDARLAALRKCILKLDTSQRQLIHQRYLEKLPMKALAKNIGGNVNQVCVTLFRIRKTLAKCVTAAMLAER